ncbi:MAG TPA: GNAT family N-acetyltransferase [Caldilineaceae bacterium]|nr:GNAT family N-acetyltransferase [Caldilineaceae bacterium]
MVGTKVYEWDWGQYTVSTDRCRIDIGVVHRFLAEESYWAKGRALSVIERSVENSLCFGLYDGQNSQVGFARAITDFATYGYLADVFVLRPHRGQGLGKWLVNCVLEHPELRGLCAWGLRTLDAHSLYTRYGFASLNRPEMAMELRPEPRFT